MPKPTDEKLVRTAIRDAMDRLIAGEPLHSDGNLTIKSLAAEAQVKRWVLTHKYTDLQDEFRARIAKTGQVPEQLKRQIEKNQLLKQTAVKHVAEIRAGKATIARLERVIQVVSLENDSLRKDQSDNNLATVRHLQPRT